MKLLSVYKTMKLNLVRKPKLESKLIKHIACDACGSSDANGEWLTQLASQLVNW